MTREELLKSTGYWLADIQVKLFQEIEKYLSDNNLTRTQFAEQIGVSKGYITQILNGDFDHKLSKLVELSLAIGKAPQFSLKPINNILHAEEVYGNRHPTKGMKTVIYDYVDLTISQEPAMRYARLRKGQDQLFTGKPLHYQTTRKGLSEKTGV